MSYLSKVLQQKEFISQVIESIKNSIVGRAAKAFSPLDGTIEGKVTSYEVLSDPIFFDADADGSGLEWTVPFKTQGRATLGYTDSNSEYGEESVEGDCEGVIELTFPSGTLNRDDIDEIASELELSIEIETIDIDSKEELSSEEDLDL